MLSKLFARKKMTNEEERNDLENRVCSMLHDQKMINIIPIITNVMYGTLVQLENTEKVWSEIKDIIDRGIQKHKEKKDGIS